MISRIQKHKDLDNEKNRIFSYLSFGCGVLEIILLCSTLFQSNEYNYTEVDYYETNSSILPLSVWFLILLLLGITTAIISLIKKEPRSFYKKIGLIINVTIIVLFATIILLIAIT